MQSRQDVIKRLEVLKAESGQSEKDFKKNLSKITGKTSRTIRRWFALETSIPDDDLKIISDYFGQHVHWLKYGDAHEHRTMIDQIMSSNHFGAVIMRDGKAEEMNYKFMEMMNLTPEKLNTFEACEHVLSLQPDETVSLCDISGKHAALHGGYHHTMIMNLGDGKAHNIDVTSLNINNGRVLRILLDRGAVGRT